MARISIAKTHHLSHRKAKDIAERLAKDLEKRFALAWNWEGEHVHFERPGISGSMHVGKTRITLDVSLGLLLTPLKPVIEREIHAQLDKLVGGKSTA
jgi:putative polyhydroxyalkanoate system protein